MIADDHRHLGIVDLTLELDEAHNKVTHTTETLRRRRAALGVHQRASLTKLMNNTYLTIQMNARALKIRIRDRLRQRKFELERLERSYRQTVNSMFTFLYFYVC